MTFTEASTVGMSFQLPGIQLRTGFAVSSKAGDTPSRQEPPENVDWAFWT
jgi:hypothetical protein